MNPDSPSFQSETVDSFWEMYRSLPEEVREQARTVYRLFSSNPRHPSLQFKRIGLHEPVYSVRVGMHYRAVGLLEANIVVWWWIGSHANYDKLKL